MYVYIYIYILLFRASTQYCPPAPACPGLASSARQGLAPMQGADFFSVRVFTDNKYSFL